MKSTIAKKTTIINCMLENQERTLSIKYYEDSGKIIQIEGDYYLKEIANKTDYDDNGYVLVEKIEKYLDENDVMHSRFETTNK